jgi:hypothetical protein
MMFHAYDLLAGFDDGLGHKRVAATDHNYTGVLRRIADLGLTLRVVTSLNTDSWRMPLGSAQHLARHKPGADSPLERRSS